MPKQNLAKLQKALEDEILFLQLKKQIPPVVFAQILAIFNKIVELRNETKKLNEEFEELLKTKIGKQGLEGKQGEQGEVGEIGEQGEVGEKGEQGEKGEMGSQGGQGLQGEIGERGEQGKQGLIGKEGSPDTGKQIVNKLEKLGGEDRLDFNALKNRPEQTVQVFGGGGGSTIEPFFDLDGDIDDTNAEFTVATSKPNIQEGTEEVSLAGLLQLGGSKNDYTIVLTPNAGVSTKATITFASNLPTGIQRPRISYQHG
ncbi:MAG TPA: collagen-like protein [bacterium]|nr:collagen-like protein [bacterium]